MQKYGEIYGHQARRQINWLDGERDRVVNIVEQRKKKMAEKDAEKERKRVEREAKKVLATKINRVVIFYLIYLQIYYP
jgi:hypothetical protein